MEFIDFDELSSYVKKISQESFCVYYLKDCRTVENANKRVAPGQKPYPKKFKYSFVKYACKHFGGRNSRSTGVRPNQRTYKTGCSSYIYTSVDRKKDKFVVLKSDLHHNHDTSAELFVRYPEQRRVNSEEKKLINELTGLNVPPGTICKHLQDVHGKHLTVKDIQNIKKQDHPNDDLTDILCVLEEFYGENENNTVIIEADKEGFINCIWFQTAAQKEVLQRFPEIIHVDGTYRVNNRRMPLYVAMIEDGCGRGFAVAYALLSNEQKENIQFFMSSLVNTNPILKTQTQCFIVDKDFAQISVITSLFPNVQVLLCRFHVLKTFRQEVSKLNLPEIDKTNIRQCIQSLVYANTEELFNNKVRLLQQLAPEGFQQYFASNWDNCRPLWAAYITNSYQNFSTKTNNRIERHNQELKKTLNSHITVAECMRRILKCSQQCFSRKDQELFVTAVCHSYNVLDEDATIQQIRTTATLYAAQATIQQYRKAREMKSVSVIQSNQSMYKIASHSVDMSNAPPKCTCSFSSSMCLPCSHIFFILHKLNIPFSDDYIPDRWRKTYQYQSIAIIDQPEVPIVSKSTPKKLSRKEKFKKMHRLLNEIGDACSELSHEDFEERYHQITLVRNAWIAGHSLEIKVADVPSQDQKSMKLDGVAPHHDSDSEYLKMQNMPVNAVFNPVPVANENYNLNNNDVDDYCDDEINVFSQKDFPQHEDTTIIKMNEGSGEPAANCPEQVISENVTIEDIGHEDFDHRRPNSSVPDHSYIPKPVDLTLCSPMRENKQDNKTAEFVQHEGNWSTDIKGLKLESIEEGDLKDSKSDIEKEDGKSSYKGNLKRPNQSFGQVADNPNKRKKAVSFKEQIQGLHLPTIRKVRGRPKGCNTSIVGLSLKKKRKQQQTQEDSSSGSKNDEQTRSSLQKKEIDHSMSEVDGTSSVPHSFKQKVCSFSDVAKLQELIDFISSIDFVSPKHSYECVSMLQRGCMPPANGIMFEGGKHEDKLDYVTDTLLNAASSLINDKSFERRTDIFQLLIATIVVAAENDLEMDTIRDMFNIQPSHLAKTKNVPPSTKGKLRVGSTTFTHKDLGTLRQGSWINDQIIHAYLNLLMHEHEGKGYMLPSFLGLKWEKSLYHEWLFRKVDFMKSRWLMMPVFKNHHWFLLVADTLNHNVCMLNSIPDAAMEQAYFDHWSKYITTRNKYTACKLPQFKKVSGPHGRQHDGHSCGVFVLMNAEAILCNVNPAVMRHHHTAFYRRYVKQRLVDNSHSNNNLMCDLPFCIKPSGTIKWVQCDHCSRWCHYRCCNLTIVPKGTFHCVLCSIE